MKDVARRLREMRKKTDNACEAMDISVKEMDEVFEQYKKKYPEQFEYPYA